MVNELNSTGNLKLTPTARRCWQVGFVFLGALSSEVRASNLAVDCSQLARQLQAQAYENL
jgi:hypothetical protein